MQQSNFAIVYLNEHWLYKDGIFILNSKPYSKLHLAHHYHREVGNDGVSCILLDRSLGYNVREDLCTFISRVYEATCVEIICLNVIVISIFRNPDNGNIKVFLYKLESLLNNLINNNHIENIYIASNFNIDLMKNSSHHKEKFEFLTNRILWIQN